MHFYRNDQGASRRLTFAQVAMSNLSAPVVGRPDAPRKYHAWIRCASDSVLIEELRLRGIAVESGEKYSRTGDRIIT